MTRYVEPMAWEVETLDVCDRHRMAHESDRVCPLCVDGVPVLGNTVRDDRAALRRGMAIVGLTAGATAALIWLLAWWAITPTAEQAEAARMMMGL